jgi:hypothetical protein
MAAVDAGMTPQALVEAILELGGVKGAALLSASGELLARAPEEACAILVEPLVSTLALSRLLAELLGAEAPNQTLLEFEGGVLLMLAPEGAAPVGVVHLQSVQDLGRVRFALRRLLPQLA